MKINYSVILNSKFSDLILISGIGILCSCITLIFPSFFETQLELQPWQWLVLVAFIDVGHVYSTLYRTYFNSETRLQFKNLLTILPITCFVFALFVLVVLDWIWFWRILAYVAVFHFIRQHYGFMKIFLGKPLQPNWKNKLDIVSIYLVTLLPLAHWHFSVRNFSWFIPGDFFSLHCNNCAYWIELVFWSSCAIYLIAEVYFIIKNNSLNLHKNLHWIGTSASWYLGIIHFNSDLAFTFLNTTTHGIPYLALIWSYAQKNNYKETWTHWIQFTLKKRNWIFFVLFLFGLGILEEGLWDKFVWHEHPQLFQFLGHPITLKGIVMKILVALLILPQLVHYCIDGFIWRINKDKTLHQRIFH